MTEKMTRRNFIMTSVTVAGGIGGTALQQNLIPQPTDDNTRTSAGTHWNTSTHFRIGRSWSNAALWNEAEESCSIIQRALELGIRYFDTASYGPSEIIWAKCCHRIVQNCF